MLFNKGELSGLLDGPSSWCRVWRVELDNEVTGVEAFDLVPEFPLCELCGSEPCVLVYNRTCWRRSTTRSGREMFVEKVGIVAGEFGVMV